MQPLQNRSSILQKPAQSFKHAKSPQSSIQFRPNFLPHEEPALAVRLMPLEQYHQCWIGYITKRHAARDENEGATSLAHQFLSTKDLRPYPYERPSPSNLSHRCSRRHKTQSRHIFTQNHKREVTLWPEHEKDRLNIFQLKRRYWKQKENNSSEKTTGLVFACLSQFK